MKFAESLLIVLASFTLVSAAFAGGERPTIGIVYNTVEPSALSYDCHLEGSELVCEFSQMAVRRLAKPKNENAEMEKALSAYRKKQEVIPKKECQGMQRLVAAIRAGKTPDGVNPETWKQNKPDKLQQILDSLGPIITFCKSPTEANYLEIMRADFRAKTRTCRVRNHTFEQRFRHFPSTNTWVVKQDGPEGPCGIVNVSKFEPEKASSLTFWHYVAKKVVTNKKGEVLLGTCSDLDEAEYPHDWRRKSWDMGCQKIEFGVF